MSRKTITIKDVARFAGVSTATVSRALSRPSSVTPATRKSVLEAAQSTGYQMNQAARNLRKQQSGAIVVFVPDLSNPFFSHILSGIEAAAARNDKSVFLVNTYSPQNDNADALARYLSSSWADGVIILDGSLPKDLLQNRYVPGVSPPVVFGCEWSPPDKFPSVRTDNRRGAKLAIDHLIGLGHKNIGHVTGPLWNVLSTERLAGANAALAAHAAGLPAWQCEGDFSMASGTQAATQYLTLDTRPTAVFCASDTMAIGFMSELIKNGVSVPDDVSVVGFDDIDIAERFIPALTTIHQHREHLGESAVNLLMNAINGNAADDANAPLVLPVELIIRDSTKAIS